MLKANVKSKPLSITRLVLSLTILGVSLVLTGAATQASAFAPAQPLKEMLNPDGTLNLTKGFRGSLDARGWQLVSGPNEPPRFAPQAAPLAVPGNQDWASNFGFRGVSSMVNGIAVDSSNNLYAGGMFTAAGSVAANYIAKWRATSWSALSNGTNAMVMAIATDPSGNVYAGGGFSTATDRHSPMSLPDAFDPKAPEASTNFVAKWNGATWSSMGSGMNSLVLALAADGSGNVYAAGLFTTAGGATVNGIAKWNGSAWSAMGHGFNGPVYALALDSSNNLYAGGLFTLACDATCNPATSTPVNYIAKWNGSAWEAMGNGFDGPVLALAVDSSDNVYAGGSFGSACGAGPGCLPGITVNRIAVWNGSDWSALGNGVDNIVWALAVDGSNNVYAGGSFLSLCAAGPGCPAGAAVNRIAKWNGANWLALGIGLAADVMALAVDANNNVYAGGSFTGTMGGLSLRRVARWDGAAWWALGNGLNSSVYALALDGANLYAGGSFALACDATCNSATSAAANRIAVWNGSAWSPLGSGTNGTVNALATRNKTLFVGGSFAFAGGKVSGNIGSVKIGQLYLPLTVR